MIIIRTRQGYVQGLIALLVDELARGKLVTTVTIAVCSGVRERIKFDKYSMSCIKNLRAIDRFDNAVVINF